MSGIMLIGAGNNQPAFINENGQLQVCGKFLEPEYCENLYYGSSFNIHFEVTPDTDGTFFYMKNQSDNRLIVENMFIYNTSADEEITMYNNPTGTPTDGIDVEPVNSNLGSNNQANGIFQYGSNIGGLTSGTLYGAIPILSGTPTTHEFKNWVVLTRNASFRFQALGTSSFKINLTFFYLMGDI